MTAVITGACSTQYVLRQCEATTLRKTLDRGRRVFRRQIPYIACVKFMIDVDNTGAGHADLGIRINVTIRRFLPSYLAPCTVINTSRVLEIRP